MNVEVYLFGDFGDGYTQYIDDNSRTLFKSVAAKSTANSQLIIHRDDTLMYYIYVRRLHNAESSNNRYLGICYALNNSFIRIIDRLFSIFEKAITTLASRGHLLEYTNNGNIVASVGKIDNVKSEFAYISDYLKTELDSFMADRDDTLPLRDYSINTSEIKTFKFTDNKRDILKASSTYCTIYVFKDEDYENEESKSYSSKLSRLSQENNRLKTENAKIRRQKEKTTIVTILSIVVAIGIVGLILFSNSSSEQQKKINQLSADNQKFSSHINNLQKDSILTHQKLLEIHDMLWVKTTHVYRLQEDSSNLSNENITLNRQLAKSNLSLKELQRTIEQENKIISEKDKTIVRLQNQTQMSNNTSKITPPFEIHSIEIAGINKKGKTVFNFGEKLYSFGTYRIMVKMNYTVHVPGNRDIIVRLYGSSPNHDGLTLYDSMEETFYMPDNFFYYKFKQSLGNYNKGFQFVQGKYLVEIQFDGEIIKNEDFTIYK